MSKNAARDNGEILAAVERGDAEGGVNVVTRHLGFAVLAHEAKSGESARVESAASDV